MSRLIAKIDSTRIAQSLLALGATLGIAACASKSEPPVKVDTPAPDGMAYASENDKELRKARIDALAHIDEFQKAFKERKEGEKFAIKAAFASGEARVHKWLVVDKMENLDIIGHFAQPQAGQEGQPVTARATDIDDWKYVDKDGKEHGGYTEPVLKKRAEGK